MYMYIALLVSIGFSSILFITDYFDQKKERKKYGRNT